MYSLKRQTKSSTMWPDLVTRKENLWATQTRGYQIIDYYLLLSMRMSGWHSLKYLSHQHWLKKAKSPQHSQFFFTGFIFHQAKFYQVEPIDINISFCVWWWKPALNCGWRLCCNTPTGHCSYNQSGRTGSLYTVMALEERRHVILMWLWQWWWKTSL